MKLATPYRFSGKVIDGQKQGRSIGFPTANLDSIPSEKSLEKGVYFGHCTVEPGFGSQEFDCLVYFGPRLVFGETKLNFEVYIYSFDHQIYGQTITVELTHFLRPPLEFKSVEELKAQIEEDTKTGLSLLRKS